MIPIRLAVATAVLCAAMGPALAQSAAPAAGSNATVPEKVAPSTSLDDTSGSMSKKLGASNGVIKPTGNVDPDMNVGTPATGTMPVIKPGQTGGGVAK